MICQLCFLKSAKTISINEIKKFAIRDLRLFLDSKNVKSNDTPKLDLPRFVCEVFSKSDPDKMEKDLIKGTKSNVFIVSELLTLENELNDMKVQDLKAILDYYSVDHVLCIEKEDLIREVNQKIKQNV
jgi:hypothetical protein